MKAAQPAGRKAEAMVRAKAAGAKAGRRRGRRRRRRRRRGRRRRRRRRRLGASNEGCGRRLYCLCLDNTKDGHDDCSDNARHIGRGAPTQEGRFMGACLMRHICHELVGIHVHRRLTLH
eukprot:7375961-Prymnesium_polylepis.2